MQEDLHRDGFHLLLVTEAQAMDAGRAPLARSGRTKTARRQTRVFLPFAQQPTFLRDQFKALRLPPPLPFPGLHLRGGI